MKELIELVTKYTGVEIIIFIVLLFLAFKGSYEAWKWIKNFADDIYTDRKKHEDNQNMIETRLSVLEENDRRKDEILDKLVTSVDEIANNLKRMEMKDLEDWIEKVRWNIMTSATRLRSGQKLSSEQYNNIFSQYEKYERVLKENGMTNGQCSLSMEVIKQHYISDPDIDSSQIEIE